MWMITKYCTRKLQLFEVCVCVWSEVYNRYTWWVIIRSVWWCFVHNTSPNIH